MAKYDPLADYLHATGRKHVRLTFSEVETIIDADLPSSAFKYNRWWNGPHAIWLSEGWRAIPVRRKQFVDFRRDKLAQRLARDKAAWLRPARPGHG